MKITYSLISEANRRMTKRKEKSPRICLRHCNETSTQLDLTVSHYKTLTWNLAKNEWKSLSMIWGRRCTAYKSVKTLFILYQKTQFFQEQKIDAASMGAAERTTKHCLVLLRCTIKILLNTIRCLLTIVTLIIFIIVTLPPKTPSFNRRSRKCETWMKRGNSKI